MERSFIFGCFRAYSLLFRDSRYFEGVEEVHYQMTTGSKPMGSAAASNEFDFYATAKMLWLFNI
jgi:hypothetical protein